MENYAANGLMFDTNIFNRIADGLLDIASFQGREIFATHIQLDELQNTHASERRAWLVHHFKAVNPSLLPTESMVLDVSKWDECKWTSDETCASLFATLKARGKGKRPDKNYWCDALIAETALKNRLILLTEDTDLREIVQEQAGTVLSLPEFLNSSASTTTPPSSRML